MRTELYVSALPYSVTEGHLMEIFSAHGTVVSARVIKGRFTRQSRGFGFVVMSSQAAADKAIEALNGAQLEGRTIVVRPARPQMIRKILCPTDFSSYSKAGVAYAISLAQENHAELLFLHVTSVTPHQVNQFTWIAAHQAYQLTLFCQQELKRNRGPEFPVHKFLAQKTSQLNQFVQHNFGSQIRQLRWRADVSLGKVSSEIIRAAAYEDVDLIIVAKGKRRTIPRFFARSISESISRKVRCPVVCIGRPTEASPWRGRSWPVLGNVPQFS